MSGAAEEAVTEPNTDVGGDDPMAGMDPEMAANPQPTYTALREAMPVMPVEGLGVVLTRKADIDHAFKHPEIFSSNADAVDWVRKFQGLHVRRLWMIVSTLSASRAPAILFRRSDRTPGAPSRRLGRSGAPA